MKKHLFSTAMCLTSILLANSVLAKGHSEKHISNQEFEFVQRDAVTVDRSSSFQLNMPPSKALPLFTAPGEILWAPDWRPNILSGDGFEKGTIWLTKHANNTTYWHVSEYDTSNNVALYTLVTPGISMGTVGVVVSKSGDNGSLVSVTYNLTGLSDAGNKKLLTLYSKEHYPKMIAQWKDWIEANIDKIHSHY
ncbi:MULTISPECIES: hypothetical protein [Pseudoalteromonas]|uniref:SRPBCC family protein n=1 Tax=Pseudoalteromonas obscura TaxID=3048491 RepID=A0ABT7EPF9_9GAMM|nr:MULTISPECIES: hypothetical protein [Pseudoalteromonas]MBQ4834781.1 hypothetical protein [Pseudoalteromonas luteoviolacea]MDK2596929.1 hypothetical protein [Pseudoalteromonas sp. P94(2023)]